jgi:ParB/RepB/Spo0J family partition protein
MKIIPTADLLVPQNRQRREFDLKALNELGESIKSIGLMHPLVVREEEDIYVLVAGERRLRAITDMHALGETFRCAGQIIPHHFIPVITLGDLDELAREEAELEENIRRVDLTWQERASATARLSSLRLRQAEASGSPPPSVADIAVETRGTREGYHQEATRREIILAKHLDDPEVKAAKSADEAFKLLRRKEDAQKRVQLAEEVGRTFTAETAHTLLNEDSLAWMAAAEADQFDVICTDPIYGINADEFGDSGGHTAGAHFYEDSYETWKIHISALAKEGFRITKAAAHLYAFCDITRFEEFKSILTAAGWTCFRTPIIWHKPGGNRLPWIDSGPQRKWELILYAKKGNRPVTRIYPDLVTYPADENLGHNAQKPIGLYYDLLRRSVSPGDRVLDPFAGSGPILPAAQELKCRATALEIDPAAFGIGVKRLEKLKDQKELEELG